MIEYAGIFAFPFFSDDRPLDPAFPRAYGALIDMLAVPVGMGNFLGDPLTLSRTDLDNLANAAILGACSPPSERTMLEFRTAVSWVFDRAAIKTEMKAAPKRSDRCVSAPAAPVLQS